MPLVLSKESVELLWLIQPDLQNSELEIKKKFDQATVSLEVNDVMYLTISSDFDYIYKLNPFSSAYRGHTTFFVFKVNASSQTVQDYLVLKLNENIESTILDEFMCCLMDYTDLLDLESASLRNETLRKIFLSFRRKETCTFSKDESNKQDVLNSLNFHHNVYVDKDKADMITNGGQVVGDGIVSLAKMASNLIETIGTQIATNCEQKPAGDEAAADEEMSSDSTGSSSESDSAEEEHNEASKEPKVVVQQQPGLSQTPGLAQPSGLGETPVEAPKSSEPSKSSSSKKEHSRSHHHHRGRHSKKHKRDHDQDREEDDSSHRHSRRHRRHARRAANLRKLNEFTRAFSQTASIAATAISTAITETASYVVPAVEEYLPGVISKVSGYDEETSRKMVGSTLGYGSAALNAMGSIKNSVSEGVGIVGSSLTAQTTQVVRSKYGDEAAEETGDALEAATNVAKTYTTVKNCKKII